MQNQPEPEISVFELWSIIRGGWLLIIVFTAAFAVLGFGVAAVMPVSYESGVVITEAAPDASGGGAAAGGGLLGQLGGLAALAGIEGGRAGRRTSGMTLLHSRTFAEEFIRRHNLMPELFHRQWDDERDDWHAGTTPPRLSDGAARLARIFKLDQSRDVPGAQVLSVRWRDPERATAWANELVDLANEMARARDVAEAERSVAYLNEQMGRTNVVELQRVLFGLLEQEQKTLMLANARQYYAFEVVDPAIVPTSPASPNRQQVIAAGVVAGIFFGLLAVFLRALVRSWRREQGV